MEPLDTAKNDENRRSSKRRISSILKAPRTSIRFSDPEELVIPVEVAKPVEKRNSKRVSFAPANDVLLFSKDVKNVSSAQSPLQDLTTTVANVDQRVQMGVTEEGIQPITGMETLLNAPLHACQQRHEEIFMVNPDTEDDCIEKTMMFAADDASMDVTHSHTIIIDNDSKSNAVLPDQNCDPLPTCRNMDFSFSMERKKGETCGPPRNIPSSVHGLDPEFENFLASLSKLSGPRGGTPVMTKVVPTAAPSPQETVDTNGFLAQLKTQRAAVDKENEAPAFMSTMMEKPLNKTRKKRESSNRSVVYPEDDVSMDMTEAHTGNIVGNISMNEPLKCLFPTQQLYPHSGHLKTTEMTLRQQNSEALGYTSSNPNGMEIIKNPAAVIGSKMCGRELPSLNVTRSKLDLNLGENGMISHTYKTSPSESDDMDITRSQTVAIEAESLHAVNTLQKKKQKSLSFMMASSKTSNAFEAHSDDMEFTSCQTGIIEVKNLDAIKASVSVGSRGPVRMSKDDSSMDMMVHQRGGTKYSDCESDDMDITRGQTVVIDAKSLRTVNPLQNQKRKSLALMTPSTTASNTLANECGMDMTKAFTVSIDISQSDGSRTSDKPLDSLFPKMDDESRTWRTEADSDDMGFTRCQTRVIEAKNLDPINPLLSFGTGRPVSILDSNKKQEGKEVTKYHTCESDDMEITRSQTVAIDAKSLHAVKPTQNKKRMSLAFMTASTKASNTPENECGMDMTKAFTVSIDLISQSDRSKISEKPLKSLFPKTDNELETWRPEVDSDDMEFTRCQTRVIEAKNLDLVKPVSSFGTGGPVGMLNSNKKRSEDDNGMDLTACQGKGIKYLDCESDDMEITRSQTVAIDAKSLHAVKPMQDKKRKSLAFVTVSPKASDTSEVECGMDMTKAFTVSIDHISKSDGSRMSDKDNLLPRIDREMVTSNTPEADGMEFTRCLTRVIETKNLDIKPSLSVGNGGSVVKLNSNSERLAEGNNTMEMTKAFTTAILGKASQNFIHRDETMAKVPTTTRTNVVAEGNLCESGYTNDQLTCHSDDMDLTRSRVVSLDSEITGTGKQVFYKERESLSSLHWKTPILREMIPSSDQSTRMDVKFDFGTKGLNDKLPVTPDPAELEMTRSQVVESKFICIADDSSKKIENLGNFPQSSVPFEDRSKALHNQENGTDMEMTRDKAGPTNQGMVNVSLSTSVSSEDHEMGVTKVNTVNIEQLNAPRNAVTSLAVPECQFNNQTNLPDSLDSKEIKSRKDPELRHENSSLSQRLGSSPDISPAIHQVDKLSSKNAQTRRRSLADLQSKLRRISHRMNEATDNIAMDSRTAPLSQVENAADKNSIKTKSLPVVKCDLEMGLTDKEDNAQTENFTQGEQPSITAPLNLKTKRLTSRLSTGGFMPKLPQRSKPLEPNKVESSHVNSVGEHMKTNTISVTQQFSNSILMDNIDDEVLPNISSDEDLSETLDTKTRQRIGEKESSPQGLNIDEPLEEEVFEESFPNVVHGKKRPLPVDSHEDNVEDEKRRKPSTDNIVETSLPSHAVECDSNITAAPSIITQTIDSSNSSNTANIRCEATFESTFKQSLFESQLEDCTNDIQKKLDDSITVLEFFKLFNLDFVIHNPRQSVLPGKLASDLDHRPKDLLKDIHINHPKQKLYEADLQNLTQKVEGLKVRKKDGEKSLKSVNRALWEEMRGLSEKELKCFGAKLKERSNFFRKRSKVQSHEMKEVLYSSLVQANLEEQLKLRGKIQEADEMLKSLDDCIHELATELTAVEGKGLEDSKPTLKSSQLGLEKVTQVVADNERQMSELEMQKKHKLDKLNRLRTETQDLESHITMLHWVNEWKLGEKRDNCTIYTFLYESLHLKLVFEKCDGNDADDESQRKISDITFKLQLDDEKPQSHAHLVHKLLSQYIEGQTAWVKTYPTSRFVPKLLHDVGLVVSRCRLLGEELRLLKMWGALRLDILDISYVDTQVRIVFSSLKAFSKFEFSVAFTSTYPYCVLQVQDFKNHIGSTTIHQIEEIVSSVTPAKNYLTKIVKRIHEALLC
ncbi:outer kinetochore KNL1 complex subunit KNL1 [Centroberyx affinis]|uniref:outer kinetochore KNL1 complex subunit KNL1 n=1 Tax=Centroberyx affinis TaxID=166261 RepID=UPI003A5B95AC